MPGFVVPRSGLALQHGISLVNTPGIIDSGYRGELRVIAINTDRDRVVHRRGRHAHRAARSSYRRERSSLVEQDELPDTVRGAAGFGSSGH